MSKLKPIDIFEKFAHLYAKGHFLEALRLIIPHPDICYDWLSSKHAALYFLANYADACVFRDIPTILHANLTLQKVLEANKTLKEACLEFLSILKIEYQLFTNSLCVTFPNIHQPTMQKKQHLLEGWLKIEESKPFLFQLLGGKDLPLMQPWQPFSYKMNPKFSVENASGEMPLIFLQPIEGMPYGSFLGGFNGPRILVFESVPHFWQHLQFDDLIPFLTDPQCYIYILSLHPTAQFVAQGIEWPSSSSYKALFFMQESSAQSVVGLMSQALEKKDADWLYWIAKRLIFRITAERYGKSRCFALQHEKASLDLRDSYMLYVPENLPLGPLPNDYVGEKLEQLRMHRQIRPYEGKSKIRLAHVMFSVVDGSFAPSRVLRIFLNNFNREVFELFLIVTESFVEQIYEYPPCSYVSASSRLRGKETLAEFRSQGIDIIVIEPSLSYLGGAAQVAEIFDQYNIDVAIFHDDNPINNLCGSMCQVPLRVMVDHGKAPKYPSYDLIIFNSEEYLNAQQKTMSQMGMQSYALPYAIDVRHKWEGNPTTKEDLGLPKNSFVMTNISLYLEVRVTLEMRKAIAQILQRCPQAVYAPIGTVNEPEKFGEIFKRFGVSDRVFYLGHQQNPAQVARAADLYLNEFPLGSCIGMLDAVASGCPVVSMFQPQWPLPGLYGSAFMGKDYVVSSGKVEDYVDLACSLITNKQLYRNWSAHALERYEQLCDAKAYMQKFEQILLKELS